MILFSGIDIGSLTGKAIVIEDDKIISSAIIRVKRNPILTSKLVYEEALSKIDLKPENIDFCVGTGYGREKIPFVNKTLSEISCHGKGAFVVNPEIRSIIDVGGQDCKVISLDNDGSLKDFRMNEKCAAGTGRYLELMAELLNISLTDLGKISLKSKSAIKMNSICSIYAQSEVLKHISRKAKKQDIAAGINASMSERVYLMTRKMALEPKYLISGGVAKNIGVVKNLENLMGIKFEISNQDPQIIGALGAAHFAKDAFLKNNL